MLQYLNAHNGIKRRIWLWNGGYVTNDVELRLVPLTPLQRRTVSGAVILAEILSYVIQMGAEFAELKLPGTGIENTRTGWNILLGIFEPTHAV